MSSWDTTSGPAVSESLQARARKRQVEQSGYKRWRVAGDTSLGDTYADYMVHLPAGSNKYDCSCQSHYGGQFRSFCSHILAVIYHRQDHADIVYDEPATPTQSSKGGSEPDNLPSRSIGLPPAPDPLLRPPAPPSETSLGNSLPQDLPNPLGEPEIPDKFSSFRSHQIPAIEQIVNLFKAGYKVVILEAPTGTGKTLISESVRRLVHRSGLYTCTTKTLQNQVLSDFDYAKVLKGRSNYPTADNPTITAEVCTKQAAVLPACPKCPGWEKGASWDEQSDSWDDETLEEGPETGLHCHFCHPIHACAYERAKAEALSAPLAILNSAYLLAEGNGPGKFSKQDFVILDEADMLESELMSYVEVTLSQQRRDRLYVGEPKFITKEDSWVEWIQNKVIPAVNGELADLRHRLKVEGHKPKIIKAINSTSRLRASLDWLVRPTEEGDVNLTGWVLNKYNGDLTFKPVRVADYAQELLWSHSKKFLLMSATVVSPEQMAADLGLVDGEWAVVHVPSTFPIQRRPIVLDTVGKLNRNNKVWAYPAAGDKVVELLDKHPDQRVLVHTHSYELNKVIHTRIAKSKHRDRVVTYYKASEREDALATYLSKPDGVLLSPSFERGVDLPHDACRVVIVAKIPYPYLGDKQINARMYGTKDGKQWYAVQTIRSLCQMTGRGMRSADDWAISYIIDSSFHDLYGPNRKLFPTWWADAIVWDRNDPKWRDSVLT